MDNSNDTTRHTNVLTYDTPGSGYDDSDVNNNNNNI